MVIRLKYNNKPKESIEEFEDVKLLRNPLPQPQKPRHIRMEFDIPEEDYESEDDYDIATSDDDDYDI